MASPRRHPALGGTVRPRPGIDGRLNEATDDVATARTALDELTRRARPLLDHRDQLHAERHRLEQHLKTGRQLTRSLNLYDNRVATAQQRLDALDTWHSWAKLAGHDVAVGVEGEADRRVAEAR